MPPAPRTPRPSPPGAGRRRLSAAERSDLGLLALPTFALALAITVVTTYLSEVTRRYTEQTALIGLIVGGEGIMALWLPLIVGAWSDQLQTRIGGRLPFVIAGGVPAAAAVALIGFERGLALIAVTAGLFFAFYFVAYEPYRALYPDLVEAEEVAGRAQSTQAIARGLGTGAALVGGGLLLSIGRAVPFTAAGVILAVAVGGFTRLMWRRGIPQPRRARARPARAAAAELIGLVRHDDALRAFLVANALWETALSALKAFVILYLTLGLGYRLSSSSLIIGGVAVFILLAAGLSGKAADSFGRLRVMTIALWAYGIGYLVPVVTTSRPLLIAAVPFIATGGGTVMTMAYAVLTPLMPDDAHGVLTGFFSLSRGIGNVTGPILAGVAIWLGRGGLFGPTHGFAAMWIVCAAAAFASLPFVRRLRRAERERAS